MADALPTRPEVERMIRDVRAVIRSCWKRQAVTVVVGTMCITFAYWSVAYFEPSSSGWWITAMSVVSAALSVYNFNVQCNVEMMGRDQLKRLHWVLEHL